MTLSHYRASWITTGGDWATPVWPVPWSINQYLYGDIKRQFSSPLVLRGDFAEAARFIIRVHTVTNHALLQIRAGGVTVFEKLFRPGPGPGEWKQSTFQPQYGIYQGVYDQDYTATIPAGTREVQVAVTRGDWLAFTEIRIAPFPRAPQQVILKPGDAEWGIRQVAYVLDTGGNLSAVGGQMRYTKDILWRESVEPWRKFADSFGVGVHVGEWGAYNRTPHAVVLAWMKDCLDLWKQASFGWALWNLRGEFGILDSGRADVTYEDYQAHKLDRKMLELLLQG